MLSAGVGRDALSGPAPHLHTVSCGPLPNPLSADATMLATQALVQRLLMDSDHQPELRPRAPQNVSGQSGADSLPGQGGERAHRDCPRRTQNRQRPGIRGLAAETQVIH